MNSLGLTKEQQDGVDYNFSVGIINYCRKMNVINDDQHRQMIDMQKERYNQKRHGLLNNQDRCGIT